MLIFHTAKITPDGRKLLIDVSPSHYSFDDNVYITSVLFDKSENYTNLGPSDKAIEIYNGYDKDGNFKLEKHVKIIFDLDGIGDNIGDDLLFVYVLTTELSEETPCGLHTTLGMRVVYNKNKIYREAMNYIGTINNCDPSLEFINFILRLMAFKMALEAGNFPQAIKYWKEFFNKTYNDCIIRKCNCNG